MEPREQAIFDQIPKPPEASVFRLREVFTHFDPHPYMIGVRHVTVASDRFGGMLGAEAIAYAERMGVRCEWKGCQRTYDEHTSELVLFIEVPVKLQHSLDEVPGLKDYVLSIKEQAEALGIKGFGFPHKEG